MVIVLFSPDNAYSGFLCDSLFPHSQLLSKHTLFETRLDISRKPNKYLQHELFYDISVITVRTEYSVNNLHTLKHSD